jgi:hypothetical protein
MREVDVQKIIKSFNEAAKNVATWFELFNIKVYFKA